MKFEDVLAAVNGFGRFQMMVVLISFVGRFALPCHFFLNNFIAAVPAHRCDISRLEDGGRYGNLTQAQKLLVAVPVQEDGTPDSCRMFPEPQYQLLVNSSAGSGAPTVPCRDGWVYDNSTFKSTLTSEVSLAAPTRSGTRLTRLLCVWKWDLVCDQRGKNQATATIFFVGVMFGAILFGSLSDKYLGLTVCSCGAAPVSLSRGPLSDPPQVWPQAHAAGVLPLWDALCPRQCLLHQLPDVCGAEVLHRVLYHRHRHHLCGSQLLHAAAGLECCARCCAR